MKKYNIEGGINFFDELYKSLDNKNIEEDNLCLITNQVLVDKFVELNCGHKFNYLPLYNDIYNHKKKFNNMEGLSSSLKLNEIRCPYCRTKQSNVLPYYKELIPEKINGVNYYDENMNPSNTNIKISNYFHGKCEYEILYDLSNNLLSNNVPKICNTTYVTKLDNKTYCCFHNSIMIRKKKKEILLKEKEQKNKIKEELKQKEKEEKKKMKEDLKQKEKEENNKMKLLTKENKKNKLTNELNLIDEENIIISPNIIVTKEGCSQILKCGINKGKQCGLNILSDCLCKRHYNLKNNN